MRHLVAFSLLTLAFPTHLAAQTDQNPNHLKMGLVNIRCFRSDYVDHDDNRACIQANLKRHLYFIDELASQGVEFVGFPELSLNGYHFSSNMTWLSLAGPEVKALQEKAAAAGVYVSAGLAEQDAAGKRWNTHFIIDPRGQLMGWHHKNNLSDEEGYTSEGTDHHVFEVKNTKVGIAICADGSLRWHLEKFVDNGARIIYGPHATRNKGTTAAWYNFRSDWAGASGWIAQLKVHAALHNHAGLFNEQFNPPDLYENAGWASGAWFIGPNGQTLAQIPWSYNRSDSKECVLIHNVPARSR